MIIKSMSRKAPTFKQLIEYIGQNSDPQTSTTFARNLYHSGGNTDLVVGQFLDNYQYLPKRKNGNALYHEVIVLERQEHLSKPQIEAGLHDLAEQYCAKRAPHQLAWGRVHWDTDYPHIHLMISSNAVRSDRRVRMEKAQFSQLQRSMEVYKEQNLSELVGGRVYQKQPRSDYPKVISREGEMVRRTDRPSDKQIAAKMVKSALSKSSGQEQIVANLRAAGFELYQRGKNIGVIYQTTGRKHRLRTLGLESAFNQAMSRLPETKLESKRSSAPFQSSNHSITKEAPADPRVEALRANRAALDAQARDLLDGFERDEENER